MEKTLLPVNLQFFAGDPEAGTADPAAAAETENAAADAAGTENGGGQDTTKKGAAGKTYDQAYIDKMKADHEAKMAAAVEEALKIAKMDEAGKASYEREKAVKELAEREEKIALRERKADALELLAENGISAGFVDLLVGGSGEETKKNVAAFKEQFDAAVQAQVEKRIAGTTPKGGKGAGALSEEEAIAAEIDKYMM